MTNLEAHCRRIAVLQRKTKKQLLERLSTLLSKEDLVELIADIEDVY